MLIFLSDLHQQTLFIRTSFPVTTFWKRIKIFGKQFTFFSEYDSSNWDFHCIKMLGENLIILRKYFSEKIVVHQNGEHICEGNGESFKTSPHMNYELIFDNCNFEIPFRGCKLTSKIWKLWRSDVTVFFIAQKSRCSHVCGCFINCIGLSSRKPPFKSFIVSLERLAKQQQLQNGRKKSTFTHIMRWY